MVWIGPEKPDAKAINSKHDLNATHHFTILTCEHQLGDPRTLASTELFWWARAPAERQGLVPKGPMCSFPRNILVCVHGTSPSVYKGSPANECLGLLTSHLKMGLCSVLLTLCLFFYFFLGGERNGAFEVLNLAFLHTCVQMSAGGMWRRHEWVVESQVLSDKWPGWGFIFRLFWTQSYAPYMAKAAVIITLEFPCRAYGTCLNWVWRFVLTLWNCLGVERGML